jgi:hypothetical protein
MERVGAMGGAEVVGIITIDRLSGWIRNGVFGKEKGTAVEVKQTVFKSSFPGTSGFSVRRLKNAGSCMKPICNTDIPTVIKAQNQQNRPVLE